MFMRVVHCAGHLGDKLRRLPDRHRRAPDDFVELATFDELHAEVARPIALADFVDGNDARMLEAGRSFGLQTETLEMRLRGPLAETDNFERNTTVETFLPRPKHYSLTASANFFQQLIVAQLSEHLHRALASRGVLHSYYIGRVSILVHKRIKAGLEQATGAASFSDRIRSRDFRPALRAKSDYAAHFGEPLVFPFFYCVKFYHRLRPDHGN